MTITKPPGFTPATSPVRSTEGKADLAAHKTAEKTAWTGAQHKDLQELSAMAHFLAWWEEVKAEAPPPHHRAPIEYFEEQFHRLEARLKGK